MFLKVQAVKHNGHLHPVYSNIELIFTAIFAAKPMQFTPKAVEAVNCRVNHKKIYLCNKVICLRLLRNHFFLIFLIGNRIEMKYCKLISKL